MIFSLLHLYKAGNIGPIQTFFEFKFKSMGFINNTVSHTSNCATRNIVDSRMYSLSDTEISECNSFISVKPVRVYEILQNSINEFAWGLEQIDIATGFEQFTTALEMTFLETDLKGKKECLAKRIAVLLKADASERKALYTTMKNYYRYRSESLHEGNDSNITLEELHELEDITRQALKKSMGICMEMLNDGPNLLFADFKQKLIDQLKAEVLKENDVGTFSI